MFVHHDYICLPLTFNNPIEVNFSNKEYIVSIQTRTAQIESDIFLFLLNF